MKIAIGCDPNAQDAKVALIKYIEAKGYGEVTDFGSEDPIYGHTAFAVAEAVAAKKYDRGILLCGTGIGVSIAANKIKGIRCALCSDPVSAKLTREHNNSNVLAMGQRIIGVELMKEIVRVWVNTEFSHDERHQRRIDKVMALEK